MKKITLLVTLLTTFIGFSQSMPINFDSADQEFTDSGSAFSRISDPTGSGRGMVGQIVGGAGAFDNIQKDLATINMGTFLDVRISGSNTITFDIYTPTTTVMTGLLQLTDRETLQDGANVPVEMQFTTDGNIGWETISLDFDSATNGFPFCTGCGQDKPVILDQFRRIVFFTDFNATTTDTYFVDNFTGTNGDLITVVEPTDAPTIPTITSLLDIYSTDTDGSNLIAPGFSSQVFSGGTGTTEIGFSGNNVIKYSSVNFVGAGWTAIDFTALSGLPTHIHFDYWATDISVFKFSLIDQGIGESAFDIATEGGGIVSETWTGVDIPLSAFGPPGSNPLTNVFQWKIDAVGSNPGDIYIDNVYVYSEMVASTNCEQVISSDNGNTDNDIKLTIENTGFRTMKVTIESNTAFPVDDLVLPGPITGAPTPSAVDSSVPGQLSITLTWNGNDPEENIEFPNILWSNTNEAGNVQLGSSITLPFFSSCSPTLSASNFNRTSFITYPNPTENFWTIKSQDSQIENITVYDILGKEVISSKPNKDKANIDGSSLKAGIYFAKITTLSGTGSVRLVKQ